MKFANLQPLLWTFIYAEDFLPDGVNCESGNIFTQRKSRIVNGVTAEPNTWNWIASVQVYNQNICGATILTDYWVVTAAHCCEGLVKSRTRIVAGEYDIRVSSGHEVYAEIDQIIINPYYPSRGFQDNYDICLIKTLDSLVLDGVHRNVACLPDSGSHVILDKQYNSEENCYIAGWGYLKDENNLSSSELKNNLPHVLQSAQVNVFSYNWCVAESGYGNRDIDIESQFCAGYADGRKDSCQGDSGGPLICVNSQNEPVLYGIVSSGMKCADSTFPGVYVKVANMIPWIQIYIDHDGNPPDEEVTVEEPNDTIDAIINELINQETNQGQTQGNNASTVHIKLMGTSVFILIHLMIILICI